MIWHLRLQNHTFLHWPQRSSLPSPLPHARHELVAGVIIEVRGGLEIGQSAVEDATSASVHAGAPSAARQLAPEWPCLAATIWHSRLQNHTTRQRPQRRSLHPLLPHAWHELVAGVIVEVRGGLETGQSTVDGATSASVGNLSAARQLAPVWPCLAATIWHSRLQNHTTRQRPQRRSLHLLLPHARHESEDAMVEVKKRRLK